MKEKYTHWFDRLELTNAFIWNIQQKTLTVKPGFIVERKKILSYRDTDVMNAANLKIVKKKNL